MATYGRRSGSGGGGAGTGLTLSSGNLNVNLSTGVSGGQSVIGGTGSGDDLTLSSTAHATKGNIFFGTSTYDEVNNRLGIRTASPRYPLDVLLPDGTAINFGGTGADDGGYLFSRAANQAILTAAALFDGAAWRAKATEAVIMSLNAGAWSVNGDTSLTIGNTFSPTARLTISAAGAVAFPATGTFGAFGATAAAQQASAANLTNNVTSGGTDNTIANYTDLTIYANDSAAIRNNIYQLARKLKQVNDGLRVYGWLS